MLWWIGICLLGLILALYILWTGIQLNADEDMEALKKRWKKARQDFDVLNGNGTFKMESRCITMKEIVFELKNQLQRMELNETDRWTAAERKMQDLEKRMESIEKKLEV